MSRVCDLFFWLCFLLFLCLCVCVCCFSAMKMWLKTMRRSLNVSSRSIWTHKRLEGEWSKIKIVYDYIKSVATFSLVNYLSRHRFTILFSPVHLWILLPVASSYLIFSSMTFHHDGAKRRYFMLNLVCVFYLFSCFCQFN